MINRYITIMLCVALILSTGVAGCWAVDLAVPVKKVIDTSWLKEQTLKYGLLSSLCISQATSGMVESAKFNGNHIVRKDDYHIYRTAQDITWLGAGWFMYANIQNKNIGWWHKTRRIIGSALLARNAYEWSYKANRWGDPFDYSELHSNNTKAIVYFKWDGNKGRFVDAYISGTGKKGALIDIGCLIFGWWLFD